jgi:hypothetical protein
LIESGIFSANAVSLRKQLESGQPSEEYLKRVIVFSAQGCFGFQFAQERFFLAYDLA